MNTHKGLFKPHNPKKYLGDSKNIVYRSWWEFVYMRKLDHCDNVLHWSSEELAIPYVSPKDNKIHRYFPDFIFKHKDGRKYMVEIKPLYQSVPPKANNKKGTKTKRRLLKEVMTYEVNQAKWKAARAFCAKKNIKFKVVTEKELKILTEEELFR